MRASAIDAIASRSTRKPALMRSAASQPDELQPVAQKFMGRMVPPAQADTIPLPAAVLCHVFMLNSVLERTGNRVSEAHDLTLPQWMALGSIGHGGKEGVTHSELGQRLMLSKAPITGVVDRLERAGHVRRVGSANDRRVSRVVITPKGEEVWARVRQSLRTSAEGYCRDLSHDEQSTLLLLLSRLLESVARADPTLATSMNEISCARATAANAASQLSTPIMRDSTLFPNSKNSTVPASALKPAKKSAVAKSNRASSALIATLWMATFAGPQIARAQNTTPSPGAASTNTPATNAPAGQTPATTASPNAGVAIGGAGTGSSSVADGTQSTSAAAAALPNSTGPNSNVPGATIGDASVTAAAIAPGLGDSRITASQNIEPISVIEAIALALQNNPQRKAAQAALEAARARIGTARSAGGPQVALSGSLDVDRGFGSSGSGINFGGGTGNGGNGNGGNGGGTVNTGNDGGFLGFDNSASLGVTAQVPIYTGGRVKASTRVAQFNAQAQASQSLQVDSELVLNVAVGYLNILRAEQLLDVADANVNVSLERRRVANVRFQAGAAPRLEVLRSDTTLADAQQRRITAVNALAQNKASVNTLMGRAPETPLRVESIAPLAVRLGAAFPATSNRFEPTANALPNVGVPNLSSSVTTALPTTPQSTLGTAGGANLPNATAPNVTTPGAVLPGAVTGTNPTPGIAPGATTTAPSGTALGTSGGAQAGGVSVPGVTSPGAAAPVGSGVGTVSSGTVLTQPAGGAGSTSTGASTSPSTSSGLTSAAAANIGAAARLSGEATNLATQGGEALRTTAGTSRESLAVLEAQIRAAEASVDVAKAARKPSIGFNLSSFLRNPATFAGRLALSLGLNLAQTIVDSGRTHSQVIEAQSLVEQLRQTLAGQRLQVANQIEQALLGLDSAQRRVSSADSAVVSGAEALRAAQLGYEAGVTTNLEVSDAQAALLAAQTDAVNTRFDLAQSQAQLAAAVGVLNPTVREAYNRALGEANAKIGGGAAATEAPKRRRKFLGIF